MKKYKGFRIIKDIKTGLSHTPVLRKGLIFEPIFCYKGDWKYEIRKNYPKYSGWIGSADFFLERKDAYEPIE